MDVCKGLKTAIEAAEEQYRINADNSYLSHIYAHKKQQLDEILARAEQGTPAGQLLSQLKQEQQRLVILIQEEELHPTFDWCSDHYWEMVYTGELDGCEEAIAVLEASVLGQEADGSSLPQRK